MARFLKQYLMAGLMIWIPLGITIFVISTIVNLVDKSLLLLPQQYKPEALFGFHIPGLGLLLSILIVLITGVIAANLLGRKLISWWEYLLSRIPLVRTIYSTVKQIFSIILSSNNKAFRQVVLIEYPRKGIWTIAFQTGAATRSFETQTGHELITVFVPTTPNPTSGFILLLPSSEVQIVSMSIEEALKLVVSLGVIAPEEDHQTS